MRVDISQLLNPVEGLASFLLIGRYEGEEEEVEGEEEGEEGLLRIFLILPKFPIAVYLSSSWNIGVTHQINTPHPSSLEMVIKCWRYFSSRGFREGFLLFCCFSCC